MSKKLAVCILSVFLVMAAVVLYYLTRYQENLNRNVPITLSVGITKPEEVALRFWSDYMKQYQGSSVSAWQRLLGAQYEKVQLLAGDEQAFAVAVTFWVRPELGEWSRQNNWGEVQKDGRISGIQWTFRLEKAGDGQYTLRRIEATSDAVAGLTPVKDTYQKEAGIPVLNENYRYQVQEGKLMVTYNNGYTWRKVPLPLGALFQGGYDEKNGELLPGSYMIRPERTAFVAGGRMEYQTMEQSPVSVLTSTDKGKTWKEARMPDPVPGIRFCQLGFTSGTDGFLILTGDKTMSSEMHSIYTTQDGGTSWQRVNAVPDQFRLVAGGGFVNRQIGFLSFAPLLSNGAERPSLYRTADGGQTWQETIIPVPVEYEGVFTTAGTPAFDGAQGVLLVSQGPNGDFQGGQVLARFTSVDYGATWFFSKLVNPDTN